MIFSALLEKIMKVLRGKKIHRIYSKFNEDPQQNRRGVLVIKKNDWSHRSFASSPSLNNDLKLHQLATIDFKTIGYQKITFLADFCGDFWGDFGVTFVASFLGSTTGGRASSQSSSLLLSA